MKKILLTGVSGFLGWHLFLSLKKAYRVTGTFFSHPPAGNQADTAHLDVRDESAARQLVGEFSPDIVIHTAAVTSPAWCEENKAAAGEINTEGTAHVTRAAAECGCRLIYTSTDRVFNGRQGDYKEEDQPSPLCHYGLTKLEGEYRVKEIYPEALIIRLPLMYGLASPSHASFVSWMIDAFKNQTPLFLFNDQFRTVLYAGDAVKGVTLCLERPDLHGLYHLAGSERISRSGFGYQMAGIFAFNPSCIRPIPMSARPHLPPSPADVSLNSDRFFQATGFRARNVREGLTALKKDFGSQ